jgi:hypothetical protein
MFLRSRDYRRFLFGSRVWAFIGPILEPILGLQKNILSQFWAFIGPVLAPKGPRSTALSLTPPTQFSCIKEQGTSEGGLKNHSYGHPI